MGGDNPYASEERCMRDFRIGVLSSEAIDVASQAFARSWHFIERDPVLAGHDRETLQAELALRIQQIVANGSERDPLRIANRAIGKVREELRDAGRRIKLAS